MSDEEPKAAISPADILGLNEAAVDLLLEEGELSVPHPNGGQVLLKLGEFADAEEPGGAPGLQ